MVDGTFYVLSVTSPLWVIIASIPYVVRETTVLFRKHIDKIDYDTKLGVKTAPVIPGEDATKTALKALIVIAYAAVVGLVLTSFLPVWSKISLLALPRANLLFRTLSQPKPKEPPPGAVMWPICYFGFVFTHKPQIRSTLCAWALPEGPSPHIHLRPSYSFVYTKIPRIPAYLLALE